MFKGRIRVIAILLIVMLALPQQVQAVGAVVQGQEETYGDQLETIMQIILAKYLDNDDLSAQKLYEGAMEGMFGVLDKYSDYIAPVVSESFISGLTKEYVGVGIQFVYEEDSYADVHRVFFGSPAQKGGLKIRDRITAVDGISLKGLGSDKTVEMMLGEKGTEVTLTIDRQGYVFDVTLIRNTVTVSVVERRDIRDVAPEMPEAVADKVGFMKIESFTGEVAEEVDRVLTQMKAEGKTHLIIDLRDNGGGLVDAGVAVLNQLVPKGPVVRFVDNAGEERVYNVDNARAEFRIVALINDRSASATEFVAAAIRESGTGILVGEKTFGKGVSQHIYGMADGAHIKLTEEEFITGNRVHIHGIGVSPDIAVALPDYLTKQAKFYAGGEYEEVAHAEEILKYLGYQVNAPDSVYDAVTVAAVKAFQEDKGLHPYGVCDFATQDALNRALFDAVKDNDIQMNAAIDAITGMVE